MTSNVDIHYSDSRYNDNGHSIYTKERYKENKDFEKNSFLKKEEICKLFSNKCTIQDDGNLSIVNNDFSEHELNLLSEYAHKRLYFHNEKRDNAIKTHCKPLK